MCVYTKHSIDFLKQLCPSFPYPRQALYAPPGTKRFLVMFTKRYDNNVDDDSNDDDDYHRNAAVQLNAIIVDCKRLVSVFLFFI